MSMWRSHLGPRQPAAALASQLAGVKADGHTSKREGFGGAAAARLCKARRERRQQAGLLERLHASVHRGTLLAMMMPAVTMVHAQDADIAKLIGQLADPKVRLRDEAQKVLALHPEAVPQMRAALEKTPSEEAQLRLKRILKRLHDRQWEIEWQQPEPRPFLDRGILRGTPDGAWIAHMYGKGAEVIDARGYATNRIQGTPTTNIIPRVMAFSGDGRYVAFANKGGGVWEENERGERQRLLPRESRGNNETVVPVAADYIPGTRRLVILSFLGVSVHEADVPALPRRITLKQAFPGIPNNIIPSALAISGDGTAAAIGAEIAGPGSEMVAMIDLRTIRPKWMSTVSNTPRCVAVNKDGSEVLVAMSERGLERCTAASSDPQPVSRTIGDLSWVTYAADYRSAFITSTRGNTPIRQLALPGGEELWTSPPMLDGCYFVTTLGQDRIAAKLADNTIIVWRRRESK